MSLIRRLLGREREERAGVQAFYGGAGYTMSAAGTVVTPVAAENLATVLACVNAIASGLATLPATVYRAADDGRVEAPQHPVARLLRAPNRHQTWPDWLEFTTSQALLYGNSLSVVETDGAGRPTALVPAPWPNVIVSQLASGRLAYDIVAYGAPWGSIQPPRRFLDDQVFHLRDRSDDGLIGRSRISRAPDVLAAAMGVQTYSSAVWSNSASMSGIVTVPPGVQPDGIKRMREYFEARHTGAANGRRVFFGDNGTTFTPISVSPEDAEVLESRRFSVIELCRLFNVPPPLIQDYTNSTFANSATASVWFATNTLTPWARKIEAEFLRSVFADPSGTFHLEIDLSGLVRGDFATRWAANVAAVQAGILTRDEVRAAEGYGPLPKADDAPAAVPAVGPVADQADPLAEPPEPADDPGEPGA